MSPCPDFIISKAGRPETAPKRSVKLSVIASHIGARHGLKRTSLAQPYHEIESVRRPITTLRRKARCTRFRTPPMSSPARAGDKLRSVRTTPLKATSDNSPPSDTLRLIGAATGKKGNKMTIFKNADSLLRSAKTIMIAGGACVALAISAPPASAHGVDNISINGLNLNFGDEDFLQALIELDADDIAEMRAEFAEARQEIRDAIGEIDDARAEAAKSDEAKSILTVALSEASESVEEAASEAFNEVRAELDRAEDELADMRSSLSAEEFNETQEVIEFLRSELVEFEVALGELIAAMKA